MKNARKTLVAIAILAVFAADLYIGFAVIYPKRGLPATALFVFSIAASAWALLCHYGVLPAAPTPPLTSDQAPSSSPTDEELQLETTKKHWRGLSPGARRFLIADAAKAYIYPDIETQGENHRVINTDEIEASIPDDPDAQLDYLASIWPALAKSAQTKVACLTGAFTLSEHWDALNDDQRRRGLAMANIIREGIGLPPLTDIGGANPFTQTNQDIEEKNKPTD